MISTSDSSLRRLCKAGWHSGRTTEHRSFDADFSVISQSRFSFSTFHTALTRPWSGSMSVELRYEMCRFLELSWHCKDFEDLESIYGHYINIIADLLIYAWRARRWQSIKGDVKPNGETRGCSRGMCLTRLCNLNEGYRRFLWMRGPAQSYVSIFKPAGRVSQLSLRSRTTD